MLLELCRLVQQPAKTLWKNMLNVFLVPMVTTGAVSCSEDNRKKMLWEKQTLPDYSKEKAWSLQPPSNNVHCDYNFKYANRNPSGTKWMKNKELAQCSVVLWWGLRYRGNFQSVINISLLLPRLSETNLSSFKVPNWIFSEQSPMALSNTVITIILPHSSSSPNTS